MSDLQARLVERGVAVLIAYEAVGSASWMGRIISFAALYDGPVFAMVGFRAVVTAVQCAALWMLLLRRPAGRSFAQGGFAASAVLIGLEIGAGLAPSSVMPGQRGLMVGAYAAYATAVCWLLHVSRPRE